MLHTLNGIRKETFKIKGVSIDGFNFYTRLIGNAVNLPVSGVDLNKIAIRATLYQAGDKFDIIPYTELTPLHIEYYASAQVEDGYSTQSVDTSGVTVGQKIVTHSVSVIGENIAITKVRFGGGIVLKDDDYIELEVNVMAGAYGTNNTNNSYLEIEPNEAVTNQFFVPTIMTLPITTQESTMTRNLGDNITSVCFVNVDSSDEFPIIKAVKFDSDRYKYDRDWSQLVAHRNTISTEFSSSASMPIVQGEDFDDVELRVDLNLSNVVANMNWLVYRGFDIDEDIAQRGARRQAKHISLRRAKHGFGPRKR